MYSLLKEERVYDGMYPCVCWLFTGMFEDAVLGNVYAEDEDDWDVTNKTFHFVDKSWAKMFTYVTYVKNTVQIC